MASGGGCPSVVKTPRNLSFVVVFDPEQQYIDNMNLKTAVQTTKDSNRRRILTADYTDGADAVYGSMMFFVSA